MHSLFCNKLVSSTVDIGYGTSNYQIRVPVTPPAGYRYLAISDWNLGGEGFADCSLNQFTYNANTNVLTWGARNNYSKDVRLTLTANILFTREF